VHILSFLEGVLCLRVAGWVELLWSRRPENAIKCNLSVNWRGNLTRLENGRAFQ
jgi:hypothetical protein